MSDTRKQPNVTTVNLLPQIKAALIEKSEKTRISRSMIMNYALGKVLGIDVDISGKIDDIEEGDGK